MLLTAFWCQMVWHLCDWEILPWSFLLCSLTRSLTAGTLHWWKPCKMGEAKKRLCYNAASGTACLQQQINSSHLQLRTLPLWMWLLQLHKAQQFISVGGNNSKKGSQIFFLSTVLTKHVGSIFVPPSAKRGNEHVLQLLLRSLPPEGQIQLAGTYYLFIASGKYVTIVLRTNSSHMAEEEPEHTTE